MEMIDKVALLEIRNRKALFVRSFGKILFYNPGGKREPGETNEEVLTRELLQELGVVPVPGTVAYVERFVAQADGKAEDTLVRIICYTADLEGEPQPLSEIEELAWFTSFDRDRTTEAGRLILDYLKKHDIID